MHICMYMLQYHELKQLSAADGSMYWKMMYNIDYKFIMIPVMFIFLRLWTLVINILIVYLRIPQTNISPNLLEALFYLAVSHHQYPVDYTAAWWSMLP